MSVVIALACSTADRSACDGTTESMRPDGAAQAATAVDARLRHERTMCSVDLIDQGSCAG